MNKIRSVTIQTVDGKSVTMTGDEFELVCKGASYGLQNVAIGKLNAMLFGAAQGDDFAAVAKQECRAAAQGEVPR